MKHTFSIGLLCLLVLMTSVFGAEVSRFDQANQKFRAGDLAGAAVIYQEILGGGETSASVLFNLGNCEQRMGKYGPAILAYERARLLAPRDPDISANLALARKEAAVFEEPGRHPRLDAFFAYLSLNEWSWLVAGSALFLGLLSVVCGLVRLPVRWMVLSVRAAAGVSVVLIIAGATALHLRRDEGNRGVVLSGGASVRLSPFEKAGPLGSPGPERIVHILKTDGSYHFIEVPATKLRGWMSDKDVSAISP